jgi:WD40 repeat protein
MGLTVLLVAAGDVYGVAWHPKKPYKFAVASESGEVYLWNARRRQLIARVGVGAPAHAVAFSPNGAHLAVGLTSGAVKACGCM